MDENPESTDLSPESSELSDKTTPKNSALDIIFQSAQDGDADSQLMLGCLYLEGIGPVPWSNICAEKWLLAAYKQGLIDSLWDIARLIHYGHKIKDETFEIKSEKECYEKIIENDLASESAKSKAQRKLEDLNASKIPTVFSKKSSCVPTDITEPASDVPVKILDDFIGLQKIKAQIKMLESMAAFNASRQKAGLKTQDQSNHLAFIGNPGTGKTEVARIMGQIYKDAGILDFGHVVEVDRGGLVGEYIGQTAVKTTEAINRAMGGILFIDEAHMLFGRSYNDFGPEATSTLEKAMEDYRGRFIVIMAGYTEPMKFFLRESPGLKSRIRHHLYFDDYSESELVDIFLKFAKDNDFIVHKDAKPAIHVLMKKALRYMDKDFGNGRYVRNCFEKTIEKMALRVSSQNSRAKKALKTIMFMDVPTFEELEPQVKKTGLG